MPGVRSHYLGDCKHKMWQAIRASSAAPGYFQEFVLGKELHQVWNVLKRFLLEQNVIVRTAKMKISYLVVILKFFCSTAEDPFKVYFPHINLPYMWLLIDGKVCKEITKRSSRVWNCHRDDRTMHHSLKALKAFASFQSIPKTLLFLKERCQRPLLSTVFFFSLNCVCVYGCVWICFNLSDPLAWRQSPDSWLVLCLLRLLFIRSTENVMMM